MAGPDEKKPRARPENAQQQTPLWALGIVELDGPWTWRGMSSEQFSHVLERLGQFERMTWGEIEGSRHHSVRVVGICKPGRDRLAEIRQDDVDELFSLRLSGRIRLYGIRDGRVLKLLWYDPLHEVYPSPKKHT